MIYTSNSFNNLPEKDQRDLVKICKTNDRSDLAILNCDMEIEFQKGKISTTQFMCDHEIRSNYQFSDFIPGDGFDDEDPDVIMETTWNNMKDVIEKKLNSFDIIFIKCDDNKLMSQMFNELINDKLVDANSSLNMTEI